MGFMKVHEDYYWIIFIYTLSLSLSLSLSCHQSSISSFTYCLFFVLLSLCSVWVVSFGFCRAFNDSSYEKCSFIGDGINLF